MPKMAEVVAGELRQKILSGELKPGDSLSSEAALVEEYDVSRPTLREALRLLEAQQLITVRRGSHRGPIVSLPDTSVTAQSISLLLQVRQGTLADIYAFRSIIEPAAVRIAAERVTEDDLAMLRGLVEEQYALRDDSDRFQEVSWSFHSALVALSGNTTMTLVAETLEYVSKRHARAAVLHWPDGHGHRDHNYRVHKELLELLEQGEAAKAEAFWAEHLAEAGKRIMSSTEGLSIVEVLE